MSNFYQLARRFPPVLVRLLARDGGKAMTTKQIAEASSMDQLTVQVVSESPEWDGLSLRHISNFTGACGMDFTCQKDMNRVECYLRKNNSKPTFKYLTKSPQWETYYLPLLKTWRRSMTTIPAELPQPIRKLLEKIPTT